MIIMITLWHYYCAQVRSSSILVRVYVSHHHENKGPPAFCIPILDVHGLHRVQSRWGPDMMLGVVKTLGKFNNLGEYSPFPVETVVGRDRMKFISNCPYFQLFNYFYRILRPVTAVISFYRLLSLTKSCKRLKIEKTWGPRVNWALESVPSRAHSEFSALLCSFNSQEKFVQGRIWARSGPQASPEHYQLVHRKCGVSHLFTEHDSCPPF